MSEILSQAEIDALLSALQSGEVDVDTIRQDENAKKVRIYDFRRPNKFSKDQLNTIEIIYENFSRLLTTYLTGTLRSRIIVKMATVDQVTYEEFVHSIPNPTIFTVFNMPPLEGKGVLEINPVIAFSAIDRLFGGPGISGIKGRPLTEIEKSVMEKLAERILSLFREAWISLIEVDAFLENIEINPQFSQIVSPLEMVVIITLNVSIGDTEGFINICLPCLMLEPIANKLNSKFWFTNLRSNSEDNNKHIKKMLERTHLPVTVAIKRSTVTVRELLELQTGDVINLDHGKNQDLFVYLGSRLKYYGKPGLIGNNLAVKITRIHQEGSEEDE